MFCHWDEDVILAKSSDLTREGTEGFCCWSSATPAEQTTKGTQRGVYLATQTAASPAALYKPSRQSCAVWRFHCLSSPTRHRLSHSGCPICSRWGSHDDLKWMEAIWAAPAESCGLEVHCWSIFSWKPPNLSSLMLTPPPPLWADRARSTETAHRPLSHLPLRQGLSQTLWNCQARFHHSGLKWTGTHRVPEGSGEKMKWNEGKVKKNKSSVRALSNKLNSLSGSVQPPPPTAVHSNWKGWQGSSREINNELELVIIKPYTAEQNCGLQQST